MAATHTLTGNFADLLGEAFDATRVRAYVEASEKTLTDTDDNVTRFGRKDITIGADGLWTVADIPDTADLAWMPAGFALRVVVEYRDMSQGASTRAATWTSNWFALTADADFASVVDVELTAISDALLNQISGWAADAEAAAAAAVAVGATNDAIIAGRINTPGSLTEEALTATIDARAAQLDVTGLTAAQINTWLNADSPFGLGGQRVKRMVGSASVASPLIVTSRVHLDATSSEVTQAPGSNTNTLQNFQVGANNGRDSDITIVGGTWDKASNGGTGSLLHNLNFRRVDRLYVRHMRVEATANSKYGICLGDVNSFEVDHIDFDTCSDGVHMLGQVFNGSVHHITGSTHDDSVAITGNDYAAYADVVGNVTNVRIYAIDTDSGSRGVIVNSGNGCHVDEIYVSDVKGTTVGPGVRVGQDQGQANTTGGTYGRVYVEDVCVTISGSTNWAQVYCEMPNTELLSIRRVAIPAGGIANYGVRVLVATSATVGTLLVDDATSTQRHSVALVGLDGQATGKINRVVITRPRMVVVGGTSTTRVIATANITVGSLVFRDVDLAVDETVSTEWCSFGSSTTIGTIAVLGGVVFKGKGLVAANAASDITLDGGLQLVQTNRAINYYAGAHTVVLGTVTFDTLINPGLFLNASATGLTVLGGGGWKRKGNTVSPLGRSGTQPIRVNAPGLPINADLAADTGNTAVTAPVVGDQFLNTTAHSPLPAGHPVVVSAVASGKPTHKSLIDGSTWTVP